MIVIIINIIIVVINNGKVHVSIFPSSLFERHIYHNIIDQSVFQEIQAIKK